MKVKPWWYRSDAVRKFPFVNDQTQTHTWNQTNSLLILHSLTKSWGKAATENGVSEIVSIYTCI